MVTLRDKNILLISPEPWNHIKVSKHHYAICLGKRGNKVFFLNPPGKTPAVLPTPYSNVQSIHYEGFPKGLRFYPRFLQRHFIAKKFREVEAMCGGRIDIVWSFDNSVFFDFDALPSRVLTICHIVDANQDFEFEKTAASARLCLGVTRGIVERLKKSNPHSFFLHHGCASRESIEDVEIQGNDGARVGYAGNLDLRYIDWNLLDRITSEHMHVAFYFAGPHSRDHEFVNRLRQKPNVYFLGSLQSEQLPSFYQQMDILVLCYLSNEYPDQLANTHKMMEYLASGRMIVATRTEEYQSLHDEGLLMMGQNPEDFLSHFRNALNDLSHWNSTERSTMRIQWAAQFSYENQVARVEELLNTI